jgi:pyrroline-5-carboxylate reductase
MEEYSTILLQLREPDGHGRIAKEDKETRRLLMKYGFIGLGNMASAIIEGMVSSGRFSEDQILGFNRSEGKMLKLKEKVGLIPCGSAKETAQQADVIVLAVKPQMMGGIVEEIAGDVGSEKKVISIAAGLPTSWYEERFSKGVSVVRVMPNINAKVKAAVTAVCGGMNASEEDIQTAMGIFETVGKAYRMEEKMFSGFGAIGGASGAFVYLYIDALADAGVRAGFSRPLAVELATQTVLGSARLVEETGEHPIALMNQVCSPAGTTIEGVMTLKKRGFEAAVQDGIEAIIRRDQELSKG